MKKIFTTIILLTLLISCCNNVSQLVRKSQKKIYSSKQLGSDFTKSLIKYQSNIRDTIFVSNHLNNIKSFQLIENISSYNGNFSGCFISKNKELAFYKNSYLDKLEYSTKCDYDGIINYIEHINQKRLIELSKKLPVFEGGRFFTITFRIKI